MMQHDPTVGGRLEERDLLDVFSPAAPITRRDFFSGRMDQLEHLLDVVAQRGQHAVVYGERGVGKTSLVTVATSGLVDRRTITLRVNCDGTDDFVSIWRKVVCETRLPRPLPPVVGIRELLGQAAANAAPLLESARVTVDVVRQALQLLSHPAPMVVVVDEFDRLEQERTKTQFADTIKALSDHVVPATIIVVGVAVNPGALLGEHRSIERGLRPIQVPRMPPAELAAIARFALGKLQMTIADDAVARIVALSGGFPYYTHALGLLASREAVRAGESAVQVAHVERVAPRVID